MAVVGVPGGGLQLMDYNQIFNRYHILQGALAEITEHPHSLDAMTNSQADGSLQYLESFRFYVLIFVFQKIFDQSTILYSILRNKTPEFSVGVEKIGHFVLFLQTSRDDAIFHELYASTEALVGSLVSIYDKRQNYKQLYLEVIDATMSVDSGAMFDVGQGPSGNIAPDSAEKPKGVQPVGKKGKEI